MGFEESVAMKREAARRCDEERSGVEMKRERSGVAKKREECDRVK